MELQFLFNLIGGFIVAALTFYINKNDRNISELQKEITQVRLDYAKKDEIKEIKELIERGFDKLEARLDKKQDK